MKNTAVFLSYLLHPVFLLFYICLQILFFHPYTQSKLSEGLWLFTAVMVVNTVVLPLSLMLFLKYRGVIQSLQLVNKTERAMVYPMLAILFGITTYQIHSNEFPYLVVAFYSSTTIGLLCLWLINTQIKASMHAAVASMGFALFLFLLFFEEWTGAFWMLILFGILSGIIGAARLYLKAHTLREVLWGYAIGFTTTILTLWISTRVLL